MSASQDHKSVDMFSSSPTQKRVLVTGGAGFLGSHLVDALLKMNCEVICVDSFFSGTKANTRDAKTKPNYEIIRHDVTKPILLEVDQIYHMACPASPVHYQFNAIKTLKTNVLGTLNLLGLAKRCKARILLASTSEVYGDPDIHPQVETYNGNVNCIGRRSCYDEGKRAAEALCMDYHRQHNVDIRIARIFNTYGPRMLFHDGRVVSNFLAQAIQKKPLTLYGDGSQTRSFCYVDDLINGLISLMNSDVTSPVNIGNPVEFTIKQLAEEVKDLGVPVDIEYRPLPKDDPRKRQPDITKAKELLGWEPKVALKEGLRKTYEDFKARAELNPESVFTLHQEEALANTS